MLVLIAIISCSSKQFSLGSWLEKGFFGPQVIQPALQVELCNCLFFLFGLSLLTVSGPLGKYDFIYSVKFGCNFI